MIDLSPSSLRVMAIMIMGAVWFYLFVGHIQGRWYDEEDYYFWDVFYDCAYTSYICGISCAVVFVSGITHCLELNIIIVNNTYK